MQSGTRPEQAKAAPRKARWSVGGLLSKLKPSHANGDSGRGASDREIALELGALAETERSAERRCQLLKDMGLHAARAPKAIVPLLHSIAALEQMGKPGALAAGGKVGGLLQSDHGREMLAAAAETVAARFPDSVFLLFVRCVSLAKAGDFDAANALVRSAFERFRNAGRDDASFAKASGERHAIVQIAQIWRVLDAIARDEMLWSGEEGGGEVLMARSRGALADEAEIGVAALAASESEHLMPLALAEPLIQSRSQKRYLEWCEGAFAGASSFQARIEALRAMIRQGLRPVPTYHDAYDLARSRYAGMRSEILACVASADAPDADGQDEARSITLVRQLTGALFVARKLKQDDDRRLIEDALLRMARRPGAESVVWTVAAALIASDIRRFGEATRALVASAKRMPDRNREIEGFMSWAQRAGDFDAAHRLYSSLPKHLQHAEGLTHYARLLITQGRFDEARRVTQDVNAGLIAHPSRFSPVRTWNNLRREGEIAFCIETAKLFAKVPQPTRPEGVVFVLARNVDQLRRYPIVVLMELKTRGWAIVPVVAGLLPGEPTGIAAIDRFIGSLDAEGRVRPEAAAGIAPVGDFVADIPRGVLKWGGIDLCHALWEEAGINRRRFNVDFTCPSLGEFLGRLAGWTEGVARVLQSARGAMEELDLPAAVMTLSQSRLPDVVGRLYCEEYGDPKSFFCVHVTNGYENYFEDFASTVSTRTALRNMTASPEMRTASFPEPAEFDAWYRANRAMLRATDPDIVDLTRRQKVDPSLPAQLAGKDACVAEIDAWRADGGKVVCAFGKLTCDLAAPRDGGPAHQDMKDWVNHTIQCVRGSRTLLLIKPHPHERRREISTFLTENFAELIEVDLPPNVRILGHDWFNTFDLSELIDLALVYNGTSAVELGLLGVPAVLSAHYARVDYPIGHAAPQSREHYRQLVRFEKAAVVSDDLQERSAAWLRYLRGEDLSVPYRYHARPITNKIVYPPWWFSEDVERYLTEGDGNVGRLADQLIEGRGPAEMPRRAAIPAVGSA